MATPQQLEEAIRRADAAGDANSVRALGAELMRQRSSAQPTQPKNDSRWDAFWNGAAKAPDNVRRYLGSVAGGENAWETPQQTRQRQAMLAQERATIAGRDNARKNTTRQGWNMMGQIVGTLPVALATANPWAAGAASGALLTDERTPEGVLKDAAIGAVTGKAGDVVGKRVIAPVVKKVAATAPVKKAVSAVTSRLPTPPVSAPKVSQAPALTREQAARAARYKAVGVQQPTVGQVTRDPAVWKFERETIKQDAGRPILDAFQQSDRDIAATTRRIVDEQGGNIGPEAAGTRVKDALKARSDELQSQVGSLYKTAREAFGDVRTNDLKSIRSLQDHPDWADNAQYDDMLVSVNKRLARYADADGGASGLSAKQAEELRKFVGGLGPNSSQTFAMRRVIQDAIDTDVLDGIGGQPFAQARAAAKARFDEFSKTYAGKLAGDTVSPENVGKSLRGASTSLDDLRSLTQSIEKSPGGTEALSAIRSQYIDEVMSGAITQDGKVNGTTMYNNFAKNAPRLRAVLEPDAYKSVRRTAMAARDLTADVPYSNVNHSNSASELARLFPDRSNVERSALGNAARYAVPRVLGAGVGGAAGGPFGAAAGWAATGGLDDIARARASAAVQRQVQMSVNPGSVEEMLVAQAKKQAEDELIRRRVRGLLSGPSGGLGVIGGRAVIGDE